MTSRRADVGVRVGLIDGALFEQAFGKLGTKGQQALDKIERSAQPASRGLLAVSKVSQDVQQELDRLAQNAGVAGRAMAAMGPGGLAAAAGIGAAVLALRSMVRSSREAAERFDALDDAANDAGFGVERLQELRYAADQAGVEMDQLDAALRRMTRRIGLFAQDGGGPAKKAFEQLGIAIRDTDGRVRSSEAVFDDIVVALGRFEDTATRSALASQIFGDDVGPLLRKALDEGADGIQRYADEARSLGKVIDESVVKFGADAADELAKLDGVIEANSDRIRVKFVPLLIDLKEAFAGLTGSAADFLDALERLGEGREGQLRRIGEAGLFVGQGFGQTAEPAEDPAAASAPAVDPAVAAEQVEQIRKVREALEFELDQLGRTNEERQVAAALRRANIDAAHDEAAAIAGLVGQIEAEKEAQKEAADAEREAEAEAKRRQAEAERAAAAQADKIRAVSDALAFELEQLGRTNEERQIAAALRRANIDAADDEAAAIAALVQQVEAEKEAQKEAADQLRRGEAMTKRLRNAEQIRADALREIKELQDAKVISEETAIAAAAEASRVYQEATRAQLDASREAADGVQRALLDIRDASADVAGAWDRDITGMNSTFRSAFVGIVAEGRSAREALDGIFNDITGRIAGRIYDRAVGGLVDSILDSTFGGIFGGGGTTTAAVSHAGGMVGAPGPTRTVDGLAFVGAPRLHGGGLVSDEVPTILQRGERVLTEAQQANTAQTIAALAAMSSNQAPQVRVTITNNAARVAEADAEVGQGPDGGVNIHLLIDEIDGELGRRVSIGRGQLSKALDGRGAPAGRYGVR